MSATEIDLGLPHWKFQKRDWHGRFGAGGSESGHSSKLTASIGSHKLVLQHRTGHVETREPTSSDLLKLTTLDTESRRAMFESFGLKHTLDLSEEELKAKLFDPSTDPEMRHKLAAEVEVRAKELSYTLQAVRVAEKKAERAAKAERYKIFDASLSKTKAGRGFLKVRDKLMADRTRFKAAAAADAAKEFGHDWIKHLATSTLTKMVVSSTIALSGTLTAGSAPGVPEAVKSFLDNPAGETALAVAVGFALTIAVRTATKAARLAAQKAPTVKLVKKG